MACLALPPDAGTLYRREFLRVLDVGEIHNDNPPRPESCLPQARSLDLKVALVERQAATCVLESVDLLLRLRYRRPHQWPKESQ